MLLGPLVGRSPPRKHGHRGPTVPPRPRTPQPFGNLCPVMFGRTVVAAPGPPARIRGAAYTGRRQSRSGRAGGPEVGAAEHGEEPLTCVLSARCRSRPRGGISYIRHSSFSGLPVVPRRRQSRS